MRYQHPLWAAACVAVLFGSCKKDEEETAPMVTIIAPGAGSYITLPDTLHVVADVSGQSEMDVVSFTLSTTSGIPIVPSVTVQPASNPARLVVDIPVLSETITSDEYLLTVQASSGESVGKDQQRFDIIGRPLRLRRILVVGQPDAGTTTIHIIDSTGAVSLANTVITDLGGAAVSSAAQVIAVMGSVEGPLTAYGPDGQQVPWMKPNLGNSGIPWFTSIDLCDDGRFHVGTSDAQCRVYRAAQGSEELVYDISDGYRAQCTAVIGDRIAQAQVDVTGAFYRLCTYQASSGSFITTQLLDKDVHSMYRRDDTHLLIFGTRNGAGVVEDRNIISGGGWEPRTWPAAITAVERTDANTYLVALENGTVERFTYSNAGSILIANIPSVSHMALDPVSGLVYVASSTDVTALNPQTGQTLISYPIGVPVKHVLPLLNR